MSTTINKTTTTAKVFYILIEYFIAFSNRTYP